MFYTDDWAFVHIPKTSGNNILSACQSAKMPGLVIPWENKLPRLSRHNSIKWWSEKETLSNKKIYSVVRNPYSRMVSFWKHISRFGWNDVSLEDFLLYGNKEKWFLYWFGESKILGPELRKHEDDVVWKYLDPQFEFLNDEVKVFKYETDLKDLENELGVKFTHTHINKGVYKKDYRYYYNDESQALVYNIFKKDFLEYDYDINL